MFQMYLDNMKVWKRSRQIKDDTFVMRVGLTVKREVGLQWQEFGRKWIRAEQLQQVEVQLRRLKKNLWEVRCPQTFEAKVKDYLFRQFAG